MLSKFERAFEYATRSLQQDLIPAFQYHSAAHTLDNVVPVCDLLAEMERVDGAQRLLLRVAAYFHDLGFTTVKSVDAQTSQASRSNHEALSAEIARSVLPEFGFAEEEIDVICAIILATQWNYRPQNLLEQIIRDADMSSIGWDTPDYQKTSQALCRELACFGLEITEIEWLERQNRTLASFTFLTLSARALYDANRLQNIIANQESIRNLNLLSA